MKLLKEIKSNGSVIELFVTNSFSQTKTPSGSRHLEIVQLDNGWGLRNYSTIIAFRGNQEPNRVYVNKTKYSVTTSRIQSLIRSSLSNHNVENREVDEDQLRSIIETGRGDYFQGIDTAFEENKMDNRTKRLVESFFKEEKEFLAEGHESQILKDMFAKFISFAGFPTIVNSKNFLKGIMYLIDKWTSFIENKDVSEPEQWEKGVDEFTQLEKEKDELEAEEEKGEFNNPEEVATEPGSEADELSAEAGSMIPPEEDDYPKRESVQRFKETKEEIKEGVVLFPPRKPEVEAEESESAKNDMKHLKEVALETKKQANLFSVFRTPSTDKNVIKHNKKEMKEDYIPGKLK